jgi:protocatechuate 3,4-dioxygenase beta subunit
MDDDDRRPNILSRRAVLALLGGTAVAVAVGCDDDDSEGSPTPSAAADSATAAAVATPTASPSATTQSTVSPTDIPDMACVITPELTEGPYFVDEMLNRSDITSDPTSGEISSGVPLTLDIVVYTVSAAGRCTPLEGAIVDVWHCDALGEYSDVSGAGQSSTIGQKFLRGYQTTHANGATRFSTIYPGWYSGRTIHIHFKVRTDPGSASGLEFTSQLFFDDAITDEVVASRAPYNQKGQPDTRNANDNIYLDEMLVPLVSSGNGYVGTYTVGIAI